MGKAAGITNNADRGSQQDERDEQDEQRSTSKRARSDLTPVHEQSRTSSRIDSEGHVPPTPRHKDASAEGNTGGQVAREHLYMHSRPAAVLKMGACQMMKIEQRAFGRTNERRGRRIWRLPRLEDERK